MPKEIALTQGKTAIVSTEDYEWLIQFSWYAGYRKRGDGYYSAQRNIKAEGKAHQTTIYMHREIAKKMLGLTELPDGYDVDHRNGNALDNRRSNLRLATKSQNKQNLHARLGSSGYKGVSKTRTGRWRARIMVNRKSIALGEYDAKEEAAHAYDVAAVKCFGEFANLNFPNELAVDTSDREVA